MATLHLVNRSTEQSQTLEQCLARAGKGDAVLLIEDGVHAAVGGCMPAGAGTVHMYVLRPDLEVRGLGDAELAVGIEPVDYRGFVALTVECDRVLSWF